MLFVRKFRLAAKIFGTEVSQWGIYYCLSMRQIVCRKKKSLFYRNTESEKLGEAEDC